MPMWTYIEAQTADGTRVFIVSGSGSEAEAEFRSLLATRKELVDLNGDPVKVPDIDPGSIEVSSGDDVSGTGAAGAQFTVHGAHVTRPASK